MNNGWARSLLCASRGRPAHRVPGVVPPAGLVLDPGGPGLLRRRPQHDRRLAEGPVQEDQGRGTPITPTHPPLTPDNRAKLTLTPDNRSKLTPTNPYSRL